jgi:hypothetical protein
MKKTLVLAVCLAVLASGSVFALDLPDALKINGLSVNGTIQTGLRVEGATHHAGNASLDADASAIETPRAFAYSDDIDNGAPFRAQLILQYAFENVGIYTRFRYQPGTGPNPDSTTNTMESFSPFQLGFINKAFIWGTVLDKKVRVSVGKGLNAAWGLFYSNFNPGQVGDFDGKDGVRIEIMPVTGLNVGVFYGSNDIFKNARTDRDFSDLSGRDSRFVLGVKYDQPRFGVVASWYHNFNNFEDDIVGKLARTYTGWTASKTTPTGTIYSPSGNVRNIGQALQNTSDLLIGFKLKPTDSLPLTVDLSVALANLGSMTFAKNVWDDADDPAGTVRKALHYKEGDFKPYWSMAPKLKVAYDINDSFSVSLGLTDMLIADLYYYTENNPADLKDSGPGQLFPVTINIEPGYAINDNFSVAAELSFKINVGGGDQFGFGFKPGAEFNLGNGAKFVVYDELVFYSQSKFTKTETSDLEWQGKHPGVERVLELDGTSGTANTLQFDFVWSF